MQNFWSLPGDGKDSATSSLNRSAAAKAKLQLLICYMQAPTVAARSLMSWHHQVFRILRSEWTRVVLSIVFTSAQNYHLRVALWPYKESDAVVRGLALGIIWGDRPYVQSLRRLRGVTELEPHAVRVHSVHCHNDTELLSSPRLSFQLVCLAPDLWVLLGGLVWGLRDSVEVSNQNQLQCNGAPVPSEEPQDAVLQVLKSYREKGDEDTTFLNDGNRLVHQGLHFKQHY